MPPPPRMQAPNDTKVDRVSSSDHDPWCSTREDFSIDVSITNVGLILTKLRRFFSQGMDRWTDTVLESSYENMSAHKKFQLKDQN